MDQVPQRALVGAEAVDRIEAERAQTTESAPALLVERKPILKRRPTLRTEIFRRKCNGRLQARGANRHARVPAQRDITEAAFVGEEDRKKSVGNQP